MNNTIVNTSKVEGSAMIIRALRKSDLDRCSRMMAASDPWITFGYSVEECRSKLNDGTAKVLIAEVDQEPVGFLVLHPHGVSSSALISLLCVDERHRGMGIGSRLIERVEKEVFARDKNLFLFVSSFNAGAIRLYERLGFQRCGEVTNYNFNGLSEFLMRKTTGPKRQWVIENRT